MHLSVLLYQIDLHSPVFCTADHLSHIGLILRRVYRIRIILMHGMLLRIIIHSYAENNDIPAFSVLLSRRKKGIMQRFCHNTACGYIPYLIFVGIYILGQILPPASSGTIPLGYVIAFCYHLISGHPDCRLCLCRLNFKCAKRVFASHAGARIDIQLSVCHRDGKRLCRIISFQEEKLRTAFRIDCRRSTDIAGCNCNLINSARKVYMEHMARCP